jgi:hypothetical protein
MEPLTEIRQPMDGITAVRRLDRKRQKPWELRVFLDGRDLNRRRLSRKKIFWQTEILQGDRAEGNALRKDQK